MAKHTIHICRNMGLPKENGNIIKWVGNSINHRLIIYPDNHVDWVMITDDDRDIKLGSFKVGDNICISCEGRHSKWWYIKPPTDPIERVLWNWNVSLSKEFIYYPQHGEVNEDDVRSFNTKMSYESFVERITRAKEFDDSYSYAEYDGNYLSYWWHEKYLYLDSYKFTCPGSIVIKPEIQNDPEKVAKAIQGLFKKVGLGTSVLIHE